MIFSSSDFAMDQQALDVNTEKSFAQLPLQPKGRNKNMGAHDRIPPIQQTPGKTLLHSPAGPSGTQLTGQITSPGLR
jgi:hypothetical protein